MSATPEPETKSTSVGEDFPKQQQRVREVLGHYREIGPAGAFGVAWIEGVLCDADAALATGDVVRIVRAYQALVGVKA